MGNKCKKIKYINELEANQNLERIKKEFGRKRTERRVYRCNECGMWHLTSKNNNNTKGLPIETIDDLAREVMKLKNFGYDVTSPHPELNSPIRRVTISGETWRAYDLNVVRNSWHYIRTKERGHYKDAVSFILKVLPID